MSEPGAKRSCRVCATLDPLRESSVMRRHRQCRGKDSNLRRLSGGFQPAPFGRSGTPAESASIVASWSWSGSTRWSSAPGRRERRRRSGSCAAAPRVLLAEPARFPCDKPCGGGLTGAPFGAAGDVVPVVEDVVRTFREARMVVPLSSSTQRAALERPDDSPRSNGPRTSTGVPRTAPPVRPPPHGFVAWKPRAVGEEDARAAARQPDRRRRSRRPRRPPRRTAPPTREATMRSTLQGCRSGQRERAMKPAGSAYEGSNPSPCIVCAVA